MVTVFLFMNCGRAKEDTSTQPIRRTRRAAALRTVPSLWEAGTAEQHSGNGTHGHTESAPDKSGGGYVIALLIAAVGVLALVLFVNSVLDGFSRFEQTSIEGTVVVTPDSPTVERAVILRYDGLDAPLTDVGVSGSIDQQAIDLDVSHDGIGEAMITFGPLVVTEPVEFDWRLDVIVEDVDEITLIAN